LEPHVQLVAPDILNEVLQLSPGACGLGVIIGLLIWTTGWIRRTFWFALAVTTGFGLYGLSLGRAAGTHPLVTALLLALAAGLLALELGRLIAFVSGGLATVLLIQTFVPAFPEPLLAYLAGGLACVLLFKLWVLTVMSFSGTTMIVYFGLPMAARVLKLDLATLLDQKTALLNALIAVGTILGIVVQNRLERFISTRGTRLKTKAMKMLDDKERAAVASAKPKAGKSKLWGFIKPRKVA
jgi:hypothetical protein